MKPPAVEDRDDDEDIDDAFSYNILCIISI
jgi:hypothetical protein